MTEKIIKLVSVHGVPKTTKELIQNIYANSLNPNQAMLATIPDYQFSQGDVLYFTDLRHKNPVVEELKVASLE